MEELRLASPSPTLAALVRRYIGYRQHADTPGVHRGLPSPGATFIVALDDGIDVVAQTDPTQAPERYATLLGGLHVRPALIAYGRYQEGLQIDLTPLGVRALFGLPLAELRDATVRLDQVGCSWGGELRERLGTAATWQARFAICDEVLGRAAGTACIDPALGTAWTALVHRSGPPRVEQVADQLGWSRQHLGRRFAGEFGLSPKTLSRVARFDRARRAYRPGELARVAAECGYADQAHLTREFVALAGCTPTELFANPSGAESLSAEIGSNRSSATGRSVEASAA